MSVSDWKCIGAGPNRRLLKSFLPTMTLSKEVQGLTVGVRPDPRFDCLASRDESRELIAAFKKRKPEVIREVSQLILRDGVIPLLSLSIDE